MASALTGERPRKSATRVSYAWSMSKGHTPSEAEEARIEYEEAMYDERTFGDYEPELWEIEE